MPTQLHISHGDLPLQSQCTSAALVTCRDDLSVGPSTVDLERHQLRRLAFWSDFYSVLGLTHVPKVLDHFKSVSSHLSDGAEHAITYWGRSTPASVFQLWQIASILLQITDKPALSIVMLPDDLPYQDDIDSLTKVGLPEWRLQHEEVRRCAELWEAYCGSSPQLLHVMRSEMKPSLRRLLFPAFLVRMLHSRFPRTTPNCRTRLSRMDSALLLCLSSSRFTHFAMPYTSLGDELFASVDACRLRLHQWACVPDGPVLEKASQDGRRMWEFMAGSRQRAWLGRNPASMPEWKLGGMTAQITDGAWASVGLANGFTHQH